MADDKLSHSIQESITVAVALVNDNNASVIANMVETNLFDQPLNTIVARALEYRKEFNRPPGKQHIDDVLADIIEDSDNKLRQTYVRIIDSMVEQADGLNTDFVLRKVSEFNLMRTMRIGITTAAERYNQGGDNLTEDLADIFRQYSRLKQKTRDYGFTLNQSRALNFLYNLQDQQSTNFCKIGIPEMDDHGVHPTRKELLLFIAARNRGKSQFLGHCAKQALLSHQPGSTLSKWNTVYYTLENSPEMTAMRLFQALFSGVRREQPTADGKGTIPYKWLELIAKEDNKTDFVEHTIKPDFVIANTQDSIDFLKRKMEERRHQLESIRIRSFPTGRMSFDDLQRDLDELAIVEKFEPDIILIDMPQLMRLNRSKQGWESLEELTVDLRGLAVDRNLAMVVPQQGNRASESANEIRSFHGSGSIGMFGIADNCITYSQTDAEEEHGTARLYAAKVRNDAARFGVLITQHYPTGQFCMSSRYLTKDLKKQVDEYIGTRKAPRIDDDEAEVTRGEPKRIKR